MTAGRPPDYRSEFCDQLIALFNKGPFMLGDDGLPLLSKDGKPIPNTFPTLSRFAGTIGVTRQTLHDWSTSGKYPEFTYAYSIAKELQDATLTEGGLSGVYNASFAGLAAKNIIDWRDKSDNTHNGTITLAQLVTESIDESKNSN